MLKSGLMVLLLSLIFSLSATGCGKGEDFTGVYIYQSGGCSITSVSLKRVQGFGDKYYLVEVFSDTTPSGTEFLGVVEGNRIDVKNGTIIVYGDSIEVISGGKKCIYLLQ